MPRSLRHRLFGRFVFGPCVRLGRVPVQGPLVEWFRRASQDHRVRCPAAHPLHALLRRQEWKTGYSIPDQTLLWIWARLLKAEPRSIVELGTGMSTLMFSIFAAYQAERRRPVPNTISIDHDHHWLSITEERLRELGTATAVRLLLCPLVCDEKHSDRHPCYRFDDPSVSTVLAGAQPTFILIDGPPGSVGRHETLPRLSRWLTHKAEVLLDDAWRAGEKEALVNWKQRLGRQVAIVGTVPVGTGMAKCVFTPRRT